MMWCKCRDRGCKSCFGNCRLRSVTTVFRIDMVDVGGTPMCEGCLDDAVQSKMFATKDKKEETVE